MNTGEKHKFFSDFNIFHAIKNMLESGVIYSADGKDFSEQIIKLCDEVIVLLFSDFKSVSNTKRQAQKEN